MTTTAISAADVPECVQAAHVPTVVVPVVLFAPL
jgi:hypothetical protein